MISFPFATVDFPYTVITDYQEVPEVAAQLDRVDKFALDLETTGLDHNRSNIHGVGLATADHAWYVCLGAEKALMEPLRDLTKSRLVIGHNLMYDLHFLGRYGIRPPRIADTMIGQYLVDENQRIGLKSLARTKLGITADLPEFKDLLHWAKKLLGKKKLEEVTIYDIPLDTLALYGAHDPRMTYDLWVPTEFELEQEGLTKRFWDQEMPFVYALMDMEKAGFVIDQQLLAQLDLDFSAKQLDALNRWNMLTGDVNPNSPLQLESYLFTSKRYSTKLSKPTEATRNGTSDVEHWSTDIGTLHHLLGHDKNGEIEALLDYRKYDKLMGTYVTNFRDMLWNNRLHGGFNRTGAVTGRLSSSEPNLQNIPARGPLGDLIRSLFTAAYGYDFVSIDQSQFELRLIAHYSKDPNMLKVFEEGGDPHQMTADLITGMGYQLSRKHAKAVNFGWAYRIGARTLGDSIEEAAYSTMSYAEIKAAGSVRPPQDACQAWLSGFTKVYPGAETWSQRVMSYARELGYVKTIGGRKRRLPDIQSNDKYLRARAERQSINAIIQGSVADIMQWCMLEIAPIAKSYDTKMLAQVHDELNFESPNRVSKEFAQIAGKIMVDAGDVFNLRVKLVADPGIGPNWSSAKH